MINDYKSPFNLNSILERLDLVIRQHNPTLSLSLKESAREDSGKYDLIDKLSWTSSIIPIVLVDDDGTFRSIESAGVLKQHTDFEKHGESNACDVYDNLTLQLDTPIYLGGNREAKPLRVRAYSSRLCWRDSNSRVDYHVRVGPLWFRRDLSYVIRREDIFQNIADK